LNRQSQRYWEEFHPIEILQRFGLDNLVPTPLANRGGNSGENELWLGLALASGEFDELDPHHLAAATAAVVTETVRTAGFAVLSPEVEEALAGLRSTRRQLFQLQRRYNIALPLVVG